MQKLIQFYQIESYLSQSVLDKIKIILPPKSIASKAHPVGAFNHKIQSICMQLCQDNLTQLNSQIRKSSATFEIDSELNLELKSKNRNYRLKFHQKNVSLLNFEQLIQEKIISVKKMQKTEQFFHLSFKVLQPKIEQLKVTTKLGCMKQGEVVKINGETFLANECAIKAGETVTLKWAFA
ncbi:MAG: hypothetical protein H7328_11525 [Bdellovibrio sp.]|nr:hypothetical protein [Bdellovibrio sp.]